MDRTFALKRLLRDFKEVVQHPLDNIVAYPLDDNIFVWHGNVKASEGVLAGIPIHFALLFPAEYPAQAPEVRLYHAVPHPNVMIAPERNRAPGSKWRLALWDCVPSFDGWSCTYTVLSTLIQMQAFLLDEDLQFDTRKASAAAVAESALELDLWPAYPHTGMSPWPAFPTREQIVNAPRWRLKSITRPPVLAPYRIPGHVSQPLLKNAPPPAALSVASATCSPSAASSSARREPEDPDDGWMEIQKKRKTLPPSSDKTASHVAVASAYSSSPPSMEHSNAFSLLSKLSLDASSAPSYGKQVAATGKTAGLKGANATDGGTGPNNNGLTHAKGKSAANGFGAAVNSANKSASAAGAAKASTSAAAGSQGNKKAGVAPQPAAEPVAVPPQPVEGLWDAGNQAAAGPVLGPNGKPLSASALKRFKKAQRKAAAAGPSAPATAAGVASTPCAASAASAPPCSEPEADSADMQQDISTNGDDEAESAKDADAAEEGDDAAVDGDLVESLDTSRPAADLVRKVLRAVKAERQAAETSGPGVAIETSAVLAAGAGASRAAMGLFGTLSQDILALIMARLQPREVAALGATCRGLHASAQDGLVWKTHLQRCFPNDALPAKAFGTWRQTFLLEANHAAEQLRCSVTKLSHKHAVLGLPIRWTTNPVTKKVDYIEASPELMSTAAFDHGIRKGVMNEDVQAVLPIYIDRDHFQRALPHLDALSRVLAPELCVNGARPPPTAWIDIIPRAMNTAVVLLATEGVTNSDRATTVFCHLHRLLLALAEHFNLWGAAASRIHTFLADPDKRVKEHTPNLGWLLPLLTLAPKYTLRTILPAVLDEAFDRSILWLCKFEGNTSGVSMEAALQRAAPASDPALVSTSLQAARTANRLLMFHAAFLRLVARPEGKDLAAIMHAYDSLLGVPSHFVCERVRTAVAAIMAVDSYAKFFGFLGIRYLGDEWLTRKLRDAWKGSLRKGYHRRKMDFSKIHRSGVSRILLKGNQYSAPPNLKSVEVTEHWRWDSNGGMVYLDASCIAVKVDMTSGTVQRSVQGYVDYSRTSSGFTRVQGAMQHSGDIIDHGNSTGLHTISINLAGLGFEIDELYLTATAFAGKKVCDTVQPFVTIVDPDSGMELCGCIFEDLPRDKKGANSAVVLCKLYRGNGRWHVAKIGDIGDGSADNMGPLFELIHPGMRVPRNVRNRF